METECLDGCKIWNLKQKLILLKDAHHRRMGSMDTREPASILEVHEMLLRTVPLLPVPHPSKCNLQIMM